MRSNFSTTCTQQVHEEKSYKQLPVRQAYLSDFGVEKNTTSLYLAFGTGSALR